MLSKQLLDIVLICNTEYFAGEAFKVFFPDEGTIDGDKLKEVCQCQYTVLFMTSWKGLFYLDPKSYIKMNNMSCRVL